MEPVFRIIAVQATPLSAGSSLTSFAEDVADVVERHPGVDMVVFPELHLFHSVKSDYDSLLADAVAVDGEYCRGLGNIARTHGIWLIPGSINERGPDGKLYNTALVYSPDGKLRTSYRKMFPWRPFEPHTPGVEFVVFDIEAIGRVGLSTCYDMWFPETTRNLAWLGADVIINLVRTTTPDRDQEVILARANAIFNQVCFVSINSAGPEGYGCSVVVGPEGEVLAEAMHRDRAELAFDFSMGLLDSVRRRGTAGSNRMWDQFRVDDRLIPLPLYEGHIDPKRWTPVRRFPNKEEKP